MDKKTKDCVFSIALLLFGAYVIYESSNLIALASKPPFNIKQFRISPGMLPMVLGWALVIFSAALLLMSILHEPEGAGATLTRHLKTAWQRFGQAILDRDVRSMTISSIIMFLYTFFLLGFRIGDYQMPFWVGAMIFLLAIMVYLRADRFRVLILSSGLSVLAIVLLFQTIFKTSLP